MRTNSKNGKRLLSVILLLVGNCTLGSVAMAQDSGLIKLLGDQPIVVVTQMGTELRIDPSVGEVSVAGKRGSILLRGTIESGRDSTAVLRFILDGNESLTILISEEDPTTRTFEISTSLVTADGRLLTWVGRVSSAYAEEQVIAVLTDGGDPNEAVVLPWIVFISACDMSAAACHNDVLTAQQFCSNACGGNQACNDCCADLAADDLVNCTFTCGANGPDGDYGNCQALLP